MHVISIQLRIIKWIAALIITSLIALPILWIVLSSFKPADLILIPRFWSDSWTIRHYYELIFETPYLQALRASIILAIGTTIVTMMVVISSSYAVYRIEFPGKELVQKLMIITYVFPGILLIIPIFELMARFNLVDNFASVIIINVTFIAPFCVWLMRGFFKAVPITLDESAALDGAGHFRVLFSIILPLIRPGIATITIYSIIMAWTEFTFSSMLLTSDETRPLPIAIHQIMGQYTVRWGQTTAGGTLTILPVIILFAFVGKHFIKGLTEGAIKE